MLSMRSCCVDRDAKFLQVSLKLLTVLLKHNNIQHDVEDYLMTCLTGLLQLLCSGLEKLEDLDDK